jgi:hypothetical protein
MSLGTENMAVSPVRGSRLTTMVVSVRRPLRPAPASAPSRTMLRRSRPSQSTGSEDEPAVGVVTSVPSPGAGDVSVLALVVVVSAATATGPGSPPKTLLMRLYWVTVTYPNARWGMMSTTAAKPITRLDCHRGVLRSETD